LNETRPQHGGGANVAHLGSLSEALSRGCQVVPPHRREPFLEGRACQLGAGLLRDLERRCGGHRQREAECRDEGWEAHHTQRSMRAD